MEEFDDYTGAHIKVNRSLRRAMMRGLIGPDGEKFSKRPFSNKANTCKRAGKHSRKYNEIKKQLYEQFLQRKAL